MFNLCLRKRIINIKQLNEILVMRKMFLTAAISVFALGVACAGVDRPIEVNELPDKAQSFLKTHFADVKVSLAKEDSEMLYNEYEVVLVNGAMLDFSSSGEWKQVDCKYGQVPGAIVPKQIKDYVAQKYPDAKIVKIERMRRGYEISLSSRIELEFDRNFKVVDIDY